VTNFGESGYVSTQSVIELLLELQSGNVPNVVVFFDGTNDIYTAYQSGKAGIHENFAQIAGRVERRQEPGETSRIPLLGASSLYRLVYDRVRSLSRGSEKAAPLVTYETMKIDQKVLTDAIVETYLSNYELVSALARKYSFDYYFFWPPCISRGNKVLTSEEETLKRGLDAALERLYHSVYDTMGPRIPQHTNLYSMTDVFDDYEPLLWLDDVHVTPEGNQLVAERMLQVIRESGS